jgi:hypothetical protein
VPAGVTVLSDADLSVVSVVLPAAGEAPVAVGTEGVKMPEQGIFFWKARYFARISVISTARPTDQALTRLAQAIAAGLRGASGLPAWTKALPPDGLKRAGVQYVARNVLGYGFLSHAMIGEYAANGVTCRLVLARADDEAKARDSWRQLQAAYHGAADRSLAGLGSEGFAGADTQGQPVRAVRSGRYLVLAIGRYDAGRARQLLAGTLARLRGL